VGILQDGNAAEFEAKIAQELRRRTVELVADNINELEQLQLSAPLLLDREVGQQYSSLSERVECMKNTGEYAGNLELLSLAYDLKCQIRVHQQLAGAGNTYRLLAKFPVTDEWQQMNIACRMDTALTNGHFDLLVDNSKSYGRDVTKAPSVDSPDISFMETVRLMCGIPSPRRVPSLDTRETDMNEKLLQTQSSHVNESSDRCQQNTENGSNCPRGDTDISTSNRASDSASDSLDRRTTNNWMKSVSVAKGKRSRIMCSACNSFPDIVRQFCRKETLPKICTNSGTESRADIIAKHSNSSYHKQCMRAQLMQHLSDVHNT
jgi:hypothetical protein